MSTRTPRCSRTPPTTVGNPGAQWPTVLLVHTLPNGESHYDWMIASDVIGRFSLYTFRLPHRLDLMAPGEETIGDRIGDHRAAYLTYEGPVSGDRGEVERIAAGSIDHLGQWPHCWRLDVTWDQPGESPVRQSIDLARHCNHQWRLLIGPETPGALEA